MNVIIFAACIPTLRPLVLTLFNQPGASAYRPSALARRQRSSYYRTGDSTDQSASASSHFGIVVSSSKPFERNGIDDDMKEGLPLKDVAGEERV